MAQHPTIEIDLTENTDDNVLNILATTTPPSMPPATSVQLAVGNSGENAGATEIIDLCESPRRAVATTTTTTEITCEAATTSAAAAACMAACHGATEDGATALSTETLECPICLQTCIHPARLPCGHIFCFLCVKGVAYKNRRCAMCRREIPVEFLEHPQLVNGIKDICVTTATEDGYQWFYEGRNGWWQYDDRTSQDIEEAYKQGEKSCTILVAGYVYIVDLETMMQQRQNEPARCRRVKRDLATIPKKGVAGLRIEGNTVTTESNFTADVSLTETNIQYDMPEPGNNQLPNWPHIFPQASMLDLRNFQTRYANESHTDEEDDDDDDDNSMRLVGFSLPLFDYGSNRVLPTAASSNRLPASTHENGLSDLISTMAATDAAIRIATNIIGSTLAHADELTHGNNSDSSHSNPSNLPTLESASSVVTPTNSTITARTSGNSNATSQSLITTAAHNNYNGEQAGMWPLMSRNLNDSEASGSNISVVSSGRTLPSIANNAKARQSLIAQADAAAAANHQAIDLFEQTLNNFHALTMHNIVDSSDDNDEELITTTTSSSPTTAASDNNSQDNTYTHRQLRF